MRYVLSAVFTTLGTSALAHPGHMIEVAGHNHWIAGGAIGLIIIAGLVGIAKGKKKETEEVELEGEEEAA